MKKENISIDIDTIIDDIRDNMAQSDILKTGGRLFYGKVTFSIERGRITHVEKHEVIK